MPFFKERDYKLFQHFNRELINDFIETPVIVYKLDQQQTEENMYGESVGSKSYQVGFKINALIQRSDFTADYDDFGPDRQQAVQFRFLRETLEHVSFKPNEGDIISFNDAYFEVDLVNDNEFIAGNIDFKNSIIVDTHMKRRSSLNIDELH